MANTFTDNYNFVKSEVGGSALNGSIRAMYAAFNTNLAASTGLLGWIIVNYI